jgi:hypothetical protein
MSLHETMKQTAKNLQAIGPEIKQPAAPGFVNTIVTLLGSRQAERADAEPSAYTHSI